MDALGFLRAFAIDSIDRTGQIRDHARGIRRNVQVAAKATRGALERVLEGVGDEIENAKRAWSQLSGTRADRGARR